MTGGKRISENYPYYDAKWPTYYLNGVLTGSGNEPESSLLMELESEATSLKIHVRNTMGADTPLIKADGNNSSSVILSKGGLSSLYYNDGENCIFLTDPDRFKPLEYSSKYYIDTYLAEMLYGYDIK